MAGAIEVLAASVVYGRTASSISSNSRSSAFICSSMTESHSFWIKVRPCHSTAEGGRILAIFSTGCIHGSPPLPSHDGAAQQVARLSQERSGDEIEKADAPRGQLGLLG
jgi:murein endopeptidase